MSGLNQQFTKLSAFTGPRVRISLSPPSSRRSFSEVGFAKATPRLRRDEVRYDVQEVV